jgi:uncharacterized membrane protein (UPF0127 family)
MFWLLACAGKAPHFPTTTLGINDLEIRVEVADSPGERGQGLMFRKKLDADRGMLFVYPTVEPRSFWMKNTSIPLSIAFLDEAGRVVNIEDLRPFDTRSVLSTAPALYALEMNRGWFSTHEVEAGALILNLPGASER